MVLFLTNHEVSQIADIDDILSNVRVALKDYGLHRAENSRRHTLSLQGGIFRNMMATIPSLEVVGLKQGMWKSSEKEGKTKQVERDTELVTLYSLKDEKLICVLNSHRLNELRTAAGSAIATDYLSRENSSTIAVIGTGPHALAHLEVLARVRPFKTYRVFSRSNENRVNFIRQAENFANDIELINCKSVEEALEGADVVIEATYSREPVLRGELINDGVHINSIGSSFSGKQVMDDELLRKCSRFVLDFKEQALYDNSGDVIGPISKGILSYQKIDELGEIAAGVKPCRQGEEEITIYKSLGMGIFDVAAAYSVCNAALRKGIGKK